MLLFQIADPSSLLLSSPMNHLHNVSCFKNITYLIGANSPCLALSSENSLATSSNFTPSLSLASASSFFACFSHYMKVNREQKGVQIKGHTSIWRTFIDCPPFAFVSFSVASSFPFPLPLADLPPPFLSEGLLSPPFCLPILTRCVCKLSTRKMWVRSRNLCH